MLGDRIEVSFLDFLQYITIASKRKDKLKILDTADAKLMEIRYLIRLTVDMKYISIKQYEYISIGITEIGKMLGGWIKSESSSTVSRKPTTSVVGKKCKQRP